MSRIGQKPIPIPSGVEVTLDGGHVTVKGPKGTLEHDARIVRQQAKLLGQRGGDRARNVDISEPKLPSGIGAAPVPVPES